MLRTLRLLMLGFVLVLCGHLPVCAGQVAVSAASSLSGALRTIIRDFENRYPDAQISLNFAGSQTLAMQIEQGAPVDLFISASPRVMERLGKKALVKHPRPLLYNRLVIAARADLHPTLTDLTDLARPGLLLAIGNRQVPVGDYTRQLFDRLASDASYGPALVGRIKENVVSEENRVTAIIAKLLLGEVDAGIVYQSDLVAEKTGRLLAVPLPEQHNPQPLYTMAPVGDGNPAAERFLAYLQGEQAGKIFGRCGFLPAGEP